MGHEISPSRLFINEILSFARLSTSLHETLWKNTWLSLSYSEVTRTVGRGSENPPPPLGVCCGSAASGVSGGGESAASCDGGGGGGPITASLRRPLSSEAKRAAIFWFFQIPNFCKANGTKGAENEIQKNFLEPQEMAGNSGFSTPFDSRLRVVVTGNI